MPPKKRKAQGAAGDSAPQPAPQQEEPGQQKGPRAGLFGQRAGAAYWPAAEGARAGWQGAPRCPNGRPVPVAQCPSPLPPPPLPRSRPGRPRAGAREGGDLRCRGGRPRGQPAGRQGALREPQLRQRRSSSNRGPPSGCTASRWRCSRCSPWCGGLGGAACMRRACSRDAWMLLRRCVPVRARARACVPLLQVRHVHSPPANAAPPRCACRGPSWTGAAS
jgi:hypothetical protein